MIGNLKTERLRLEPLAAHHVPAYLAYQLRNREHLTPWEPFRPDSYFTAESVTHEIARSELDDTSRRFAIFEGAGETIVGLMNVWNIRRGAIHSAIVGYSIDVRHQRRGFATEALRAIIAFVFDELNLHRIECTYQPENSASARVLRKLGFTPEGYARDHLFINGAWRDAILLSLINPNWTPR